MRRYKSVFDVPRTEVFKRFEEAVYLDDNNNLVNGSEPVVIPDVTGDLQIYKRRPQSQLEAPTGYTLEGAFYFSTLLEFNLMDQVTAKRADIMEKDGRVWYFWRKVSGGTGGPLSTDSYNDYILLLESLPNSGNPL